MLEFLFLLVYCCNFFSSFVNELQQNQIPAEIRFFFLPEENLPRIMSVFILDSSHFHSLCLSFENNCENNKIISELLYHRIPERFCVISMEFLSLKRTRFSCETFLAVKSRARREGCIHKLHFRSIN